LDPVQAAPLQAHLALCASCRGRADAFRAVGEAISDLVEPGPECLDPETMAAVLDGAAVPDHVKACPRCASELQALRPTERALATRRRVQARPSWIPWAAAAGVVFIVGIAALALRKEDPIEVLVHIPEMRRIPAPPPPPPEEQDPVTLPTAPPVEPPLNLPLPVETPKAPVPVETPKPATPVVEPEAPKTPVAPAPAEPSKGTVAEAPKAVLAMAVRSGGLQALSGGKWIRPARVEEGMTLRAEGRTQVDFAKARLTLEGNARFQVAPDEVTLAEGGLSAEIPPGSAFGLRIGGDRVVADTSASRVLLIARPDRIVVEEGVARWGGRLLPEGIEHQLKKGRFEAQRRRSMGAAVRPPETVSWKMDLSSMPVVRKRIAQGRLEVMPEGRMLASAPLPGNTFFHGQAQWYNGGEEQPLFTVKPTTHLRFRYFLTEEVPLELVLWNQTKGENFNKPLVGIPRQWTTVTIALKDIPPNRGGQSAPCEVGDRYVSVGLFVGKPGQPADVYLDRIEVVEIEK
jgi:hypothetical protein